MNFADSIISNIGIFKTIDQMIDTQIERLRSIV